MFCKSGCRRICNNCYLGVKAKVEVKVRVGEGVEGVGVGVRAGRELITFFRTQRPLSHQYTCYRIGDVSKIKEQKQKKNVSADPNGRVPQDSPNAP